jgi:hypothetical protein
MEQHHFIFLHESSDNEPLVLNSEYILYARKDDDGTQVVSYDYHESLIMDTEYTVNETPEKIFTLCRPDQFVLLHEADGNTVVLVRTNGIIGLQRIGGDAQNGPKTQVHLIGSEMLEVNEMPMSIRDIIVNKKQAKTLKPAQPKTKKS